MFGRCKRIAVASLVGVGLAGSVVGCGSSSTKSSPSSSASSQKSSPSTTQSSSSSSSTSSSSSSSSSASGKLTLDTYNKISNGMTEAQVTALAGQCSTTSDTTVAGIESKVLTCPGDQPNSSGVFTFNNGTLISKTAVGLQGGLSTQTTGTMTLDKFNRINTGMSEADALAIAGTCQKVSDTSVAGITSTSYICYASDGISNAVLLFQGGKLFSKTNIGLK